MPGLVMLMPVTTPLLFTVAVAVAWIPPLGGAPIVTLGMLV